MDGNRLPVRVMHCQVEGTGSRGRQSQKVNRQHQGGPGSMQLGHGKSAGSEEDRNSHRLNLIVAIWLMEGRMESHRLNLIS